MIKFIQEEEKPKTVPFEEIGINEFFLNFAGSLCQKRNEKSYCKILNPGGQPCCEIFDWRGPLGEATPLPPHKITFDSKGLRIEPEEVEEEQPTFGDVEEDQFFIDRDGVLCQKTTGYTATMIADNEGNPFSDRLMDFVPLTEIKRILPKITKITW